MEIQIQEAFNAFVESIKKDPNAEKFVLESSDFKKLEAEIHSLHFRIDCIMRDMHHLRSMIAEQARSVDLRPPRAKTYAEVEEELRHSQYYNDMLKFPMGMRNVIRESSKT